MRAGAAPRPGVGSSDGERNLNSYFLRINYNYDERYLLTLTGRVDGSSKFGPNTKYGYFPSIGVAWNASSEEFYQTSSDRKSTRLNSSHVAISYAVFCLTKKRRRTD